LRKAIIATFSAVMVTSLLSTDPVAWPQEPAATSDKSNMSDGLGLVVRHPFSAIKYARQVKVLPDGKLQFIRNERYPIRIARDNDGRLMMQVIHSDDLGSECDRLDLKVPPVCPSWRVFVIDPVRHTLTHWTMGEIGAPGAVDFPLTPERLQEAADLTSSLPALGPDFTDVDGKISAVDLSYREIEGISVHGMRWTLHYDANRDGQVLHRTRIHEVWASMEMQLIVRVVDGDPSGEETIWGLEKILLAPDATLFRPPEGYKTQHRTSARWTGMIDHFISDDFEFLHQWFAK
jgi:hypothetical protein